ncbi:hypothetical protein Tco_0688447 [Tanacetum coccineum]
MTKPHPAPFSATTPRAKVFALFVIISDTDNEITTLPVRPAPPSPDRTLALYGYPLDSGDDSSDEDLSETAKSLHTQTASTSIVHAPPTRPLPTSHAFARRPRKEISMPVGFRASMDRWRATSPSICHPLLPSEIQSSSSPPSLLLSPSSPPASLLPSTSHKRSRSPSPSLPPSVSPSPSPLPSPPPSAVPPPPEHIELEIIELHSRAEYAESCLERSHERKTRDEAHMTNMTEKYIETLRTGAETAEQRAETQQVSLGAAQIDVRDLIESRETDRLEMAELRSRGQDIEASF